MMSTQSVRLPAVAGMFYPGDAVELAAEIDRLLDEAQPLIGPPKALIVPHAGYVYSGPLAATALAQIKPLRNEITRVVILGPNHRVPLAGLAMPSSAAFTTPLGDVPVDQAALRALDDLPQCSFNDAAHAQEHALEVMLPFLQRLLDKFTIVPLIIGQIEAGRLGAVLDRLWGGPETLIIVSSDLSHFHSADEARRTDMDSARIIERLAFCELSGERACGFHPLSGLLDQAARRDLRITRLGLCHSGDVSGDQARVVGYGAWGFEYAASARTRQSDRAALQDIARRAIIDGAQSGASSALELHSLPPSLHTLRASFTTINVDGRFRGCRGTIEPDRCVAEDVARNAFLSAFKDPRVPPLSLDEARRAEIGISILSHPRLMDCRSTADLCRQLSPDRDGLILAEHDRRALFLPKVWDDLPDVHDFVAELKQKGGWAAQHWSGEMRAERFSAEYF